MNAGGNDEILNWAAAQACYAPFDAEPSYSLTLRLLD